MYKYICMLVDRDCSRTVEHEDNRPESRSRASLLSRSGTKKRCVKELNNGSKQEIKTEGHMEQQYESTEIVICTVAPACSGACGRSVLASNVAGCELRVARDESN